MREGDSDPDARAKHGVEIAASIGDSCRVDDAPGGAVRAGRSAGDGLVVERDLVGQTGGPDRECPVERMPTDRLPGGFSLWTTPAGRRRGVRCGYVHK